MFYRRPHRGKQTSAEGDAFAGGAENAPSLCMKKGAVGDVAAEGFVNSS